MNFHFKGLRLWLFGLLLVMAISGDRGIQVQAAKAVKITYAKVAEDGRVEIRAKVRKQVSGGKKYYLVKVNGLNNKPVSVLAKTKKKDQKKLTFKLSTGDKANVISKFGIAIKQGKKLKLISNARYLSNPEAIAANTREYQYPSSKKGIHWADDTNLDAKHTLVNLNLKDLIEEKGEGEPYVYNGKTYYFDDTMQQDVKRFVSQGCCVTMVIYLTWDSDHKDLIYPGARQSGNYWYMLNTEDNKVREKLEAAFCYLGEKFSKKKCLVSNWVLGNEVNSQKQWNHAGNLSFKKYVKGYVQAFKMLSDAVHTSWSNARVYVPLDNAWNIPVSEMGWNGKTFLTEFAKVLRKECSYTSWNLAYHAYSFPLTSAPYEENQYVTDSADSYYITPKNIEELADYIEKTYGSDTRIILSEQGYTATMGQDKQAASILYAYYKAEFNPMIDAYIIRNEYDDAGEVAQGLALGLSKNGTKRKAYNVFKYMDSEKSVSTAKKYLKVIGANSWEEIIPGYDASRF